MTPEKKLQTQVINYFKKLQKEDYPIYIERRSSGGPGYKKGTADLFVVINGKHIEIEIKQKGGEMSPLQIKWREFCFKNNISYLLIYDIDQLDIYVKSFLDIKINNS